MANALGFNAFVNGMMQGQRFRQGNEEFELRKRGLESEQTVREMQLREAQRALQEDEDFRAAMGGSGAAMPIPGAPVQPPPASSTTMQPGELGPLGSTTTFDPAQTQTLPQAGAASQALPLQQPGMPAQADPIGKLADAYRRETAYWLQKGKADKAAAAYEKLSRVRDVSFFKSMSRADQQYEATKDPRVYLPVFNDSWDNGMKANIDATGNPEKPWRVTLTGEDGQSKTLDPMDNKGIESLVARMRDPQARRKAELERDMLTFKSDLKMREEGYKANVEGQWKAVAEGAKDGRVTPKDQAGNAEIMGARSTLQRMGVHDVTDARLNERDEMSGQPTAQAKELQRLWVLSRQHLIGKDDPAHAQMATGVPAGESSVPAGAAGPTAAHIEALKQNPQRASEFDAKFGAGASRRYISSQAPAASPAPARVPSAEEEALAAQMRAIVPQSEQEQALPGASSAQPGQPMFGAVQALPTAQQPVFDRSAARQKEQQARRAFDVSIGSMTSQQARDFLAKNGGYLTASQVMALNKRITGATKPTSAGR